MYDIRYNQLTQRRRNQFQSEGHGQRAERKAVTGSGVELSTRSPEADTTSSKQLRGEQVNLASKKQKPVSYVSN